MKPAYLQAVKKFYLNKAPHRVVLTRRLNVAQGCCHYNGAVFRPKGILHDGTIAFLTYNLMSDHAGSVSRYDVILSLCMPM